MPEHPLLNFFDQLKIDNTYELFFPEREQGLVIIWLYEKIREQIKELRGAFRETKKIKNGVLDHTIATFIHQKMIGNV